jgi:hypothetical protein
MTVYTPYPVSPQEDALMLRFVERFRDQVLGVIHGFDRLVFHGVLRPLLVVSGMMYFLGKKQVLLKDFGPFAQQTTERIKEASLQVALDAGRPIPYMPRPQDDKQARAEQIARDEGITEGLIAVLRSSEVLRGYGIRRDPASKKLQLVPETRKCLHLYHYLIDPVFGFLSVRVQTWFPFTIRVCINGRECLARAMDRAGLRYERRENCFPWIEDIPRAQELMDQLLRTAWPAELRRLARAASPAYPEILHPCMADYCWMTQASEWASDVMFRSPAALAAIYPQLARHGVATFQSPDVLRFLGRKPHGNFQGEVTSDLKRRPEGVRVKHTVGQNSIKLYDKQGSVLRVETTINNPRDFKVYRPKEGARKRGSGKAAQKPPARAWRKMRKGVADLHRRAEVSQAANERYLDALASLDTSTPVGELVRGICRPTRWHGQRVRALRPWSEEDRPLLQAVLRGEFAINGFRNRDLQAILSPRPPKTPEDAVRRRGVVTRKLRLLRAHGLIRKVPSTHRYVLSTKGRDILTAVIATQELTIQELRKAAA